MVGYVIGLGRGLGVDGGEGLSRVMMDGLSAELRSTGEFESEDLMTGGVMISTWRFTSSSSESLSVKSTISIFLSLLFSDSSFFVFICSK